MTKRIISPEGLEKIRLANEDRFFLKAKEKYGGRFLYDRVAYVKQKTPIEIGCRVHGYFKQTPDAHLHSHGCPSCGAEAGVAQRKSKGETQFNNTFRKRLGSRLEILSPYKGRRQPIECRCKIHNHTFWTIPDRLTWVAHGCDKCAKESIATAHRITPEKFLGRLMEKYGKSLDYSKTRPEGIDQAVIVTCPRHGDVELTVRSLLYSRRKYGCPKCGKVRKGYASYRLAQLEKNETASGVITIALMKVEVFGMTSYKLGTTNRKLLDRYGEALREIIFEAAMNEADALRLEQLLQGKYYDYRDQRIFKAGMRNGQRWSGDSELYLNKAVPLILGDLKRHIADIQEGDPHYWERQPKLVPPILRIRPVRKEKGVFNPPKPVIYLNDGKRYPSASEAARTLGLSSLGNLTSVCTGMRTEIKGYKFAYVEDFERGIIPARRQKRTGSNSVNARPVVCLDTGERFPTSIVASRVKNCSASHITSGCRGRRGLVGGYRWAYADDYERGTVPKFTSKLGNPKKVVFLDTGQVFDSLALAAKATGLSRSAVSLHCLRKRRRPRFRFLSCS